MVRKHANVHKSLLFKVFAKLGKFQARVEPERSSRGPGGLLARPPSWPRQAPSWVPWTPTPTPPRLETFLLLQKFLLYICPDSSGTISRNFVCFLSRYVSARKTFRRSRCHGFPKFPQGQVRRERHQPLTHRGEEAPPNSLGGGWCPPQTRSKGNRQGGERRG